MPLAQLLILLPLLVYTAAIPLEEFYPFGTDAGDALKNCSFQVSFGDNDVYVSNITV